MMRKAFTLMEVNLAILIMAGGGLSVCGLFSLGYRENRQSREDVAASSYADAVISPLVMAIGATNIRWSVFKTMPSYPSDRGWSDYFNSQGIVTSDPESQAKSVFDAVMGKMSSAAKGPLNVNTTFPSAAAANMRAGLVVQHDEDSAIVKICFRATKHPSELLAMPIFYTEVRFQGLANE